MNVELTQLQGLFLRFQTTQLADEIAQLSGCLGLVPGLMRGVSREVNAMEQR